MEEIISRANELGLMIKGTDVYKRYVEVVKKLEENPESRKLLEEFAQLSETVQQKEGTGQPVEVEEKQKIEELSAKVSEDELLKEFITAQSYYMNLMMMIQKAISEPEGEPIDESKIVKPNQPGKIITDL
ncbi:MAG TPA: YlbF family regulator [Spirochaetota bacterium]|nr:YlbF family regulator [Spirochaetota bacterium]